VANSFDEKYKKNIDGLAVANKVDVGTAAAMLQSNLAGKTSYQGGGVLDYNTANADLKKYIASEEGKGSSGGGGNSGSSFYDTSNEDYLTRLSNERENAQIAALKKSVDNTVSGYEEDIKNIPAQYQPLKDQTEVNRYASQKILNESLANTGQTASGFGRTETLDLQTGQNKELSTINATEKAAINKLKLAISQAKEAKSQQELSIKSNSTADLMESLYNERLRATSEAKEDYANTVGAYDDDYQAEIDNLLAQGLSANDYRIKLLKAQQANKKTAQAQAEAEADQKEFENWLKEQANNRENAETEYSTNKPYYKSSSGKGTSKPTLTYTQAKQLYEDGVKTEQVTDALHYYTNQSFEGNLAEVDKRLSKLSVPSSKQALIESYNTTGKLTDEEAVILLKKHGLMR
jgi:hypothetical protein